MDVVESVQNKELIYVKHLVQIIEILPKSLEI